MAKVSASVIPTVWCWCLLLLVTMAVGVRGAEPLVRAHAHNDYLHRRPLLDALSRGFWSVEADVWLTNGQLLVAHDLDKVDPSRTLQALYLDPLRQFASTNRQAFATAGPVTLLIDFKSEATNTWQALHQVLAPYRDILSRFEGNVAHPAQVTVIISGNRPTALVAAEPVRWAAVDGRLPDLTNGPSSTLMPLVSDHWGRNFTWKGTGPVPEVDRVRLRSLAAMAHAQGRRIRFWAVPDTEPAWRELREAGVDLINTDRLAELERFLRRP